MHATARRLLAAPRRPRPGRSFGPASVPRLWGEDVAGRRDGIARPLAVRRLRRSMASSPPNSTRAGCPWITRVDHHSAHGSSVSRCWFGSADDASDASHTSAARPVRVHLPALGQNGTLRLRSEAGDVAGVTIVSQWRDDAVVELRATPMDGARDVSAPGNEDGAEGDAASDTFGHEGSSDTISSTQTFGRLQFASQKEGIDTSMGRKGALVEVDILPSPSNDNPVEVIATVPEKSNITISIAHGDIDVVGKVEGDAHLTTRSGNIAVSKLRGHRVMLEAGTDPNSEGGEGHANTDFSGVIHVKKAVEARSVTINAASRVRARMLNGSHVHIHARPTRPTSTECIDLDDDDEGAVVDVGSLYVSGGGEAEGDNEAVLIVDDSHSAAIDGRRGLVRVKSTHGHVTVHAQTDRKASSSSMEEHPPPLVDLGGVNGSCDIALEASSGTIKDGTHGEGTATRVHFDALTPASISTVATRGRAGSSSVTMDRKLDADVRLLSVHGSGWELPSGVDAHALTGEDADEIQSVLMDVDGLISRSQSDTSGGRNNAGDEETDSAIMIETDAYAGERGLDALGANDDGRELSPGVEYAQGTMRNRSGEPDSRFDVRSRGKINIDGAASQALHGFQGKKKEDALSGPASSSAPMPLLAVATDGKIKLETLSWFGSIARRYGMEEDSGRGVGRQASRSPRLKK